MELREEVALEYLVPGFPGLNLCAVWIIQNFKRLERAIDLFDQFVDFAAVAIPREFLRQIGGVVDLAIVSEPGANICQEIPESIVLSGVVDPVHLRSQHGEEQAAESVLPEVVARVHFQQPDQTPQLRFVLAIFVSVLLRRLEPVGNAGWIRILPFITARKLALLHTP